MRVRTVATLGLCAAAVSCAALGCGPSFQAVHDNEARFEHCYALDEDPNAALEKKADCWNDWSRRYTYGQTRDRVQYAVQRYRALSRVPVAPTDEAMMGAAPGEGVQGATVAPAPTNAYAPPPKTMEAAEADAGAASDVQGSRSRSAGNAPPPAPKPPALACADDCESTWKSCRADCRDRKCDDCDRTYKACLRKCLK